MNDPFHHYASRLREFIGRPPESRTESSPEFSALACELFGLQFQHNAPFQAWCRNRSVNPSSVADWRDIPALPAEAFKELEVTSIPPDQRTVEFRSSGTTGHIPSRHFHHADSLALYDESVKAGFARCLRAGGQPPLMLALTPSGTAAPQSSLVHMFEVVIREFGARDSTFLGRVESTGWVLPLAELIERLARACAAKEAVFLLGTAFHFVHLLDALETRHPGISLPAGSQLLETGGYKGRSRELTRDALHRQLAASLGLPVSAILTEYGMSELCSQAYSQPRTGNRSPFTLRFPHWARAVAVSPETGREVADGGHGLLRVCDLANAWSAMAIQTADLAVRHGDDFELLGRAPDAEVRGCSLLSIAPR